MLLLTSRTEVWSGLLLLRNIQLQCLLLHHSRAHRGAMMGSSGPGLTQTITLILMLLSRPPAACLPHCEAACTTRRRCRQIGTCRASTAAAGCQTCTCGTGYLQSKGLRATDGSQRLITALCRLLLIACLWLHSHKKTTRHCRERRVGSSCIRASQVLRSMIGEGRRRCPAHHCTWISAG